MMKSVLVVLLLAWSNQAFSEEIDLYIDNSIVNDQRPGVLIILDNSPSMDWWDLAGDNVSPTGVNNSESRAHLAREIVIDLINDNPDIDFALQIFNRNSSSVHGGRIVFPFKDLSDADNKDELISILDTDNNNTDNDYTVFVGNGTPLCETLYETYLYLAGGALKYGNQDTRIPQSIITSGDYPSPFSGMTCNKEINIIYITDGEPTIDDNANGLVETLTGNSTPYSVNGTDSYLGVLGSWMATKNWVAPNITTTFDDINDTPKANLLASVKIHTVGFASFEEGAEDDTVDLLKLAARDGVLEVDRDGYHSMPAGGEYYPASTAEALKDALQSIVFEVLGSSTLTSASVSANSFDRTQTLDSVYYGMFEPSSAARWQGNLKKYKIVNGEQVDALGNAAIDATGEFDEDSKSFWTAAVDGNNVAEGGVAEMLRTTVTTDRRFLTDVGVTPSPTATLPVFTTAENIISKYADNDALIVPFGVPLSEVSNISDHIKWAMGVNVDDDKNEDDTISDVRPDVFGDPLHSKPIVINYGTGNPRIVVGTNSGVLHMFEDNSTTNTVSESWAYLPEEFFKNIKPLRENTVAVDNKVYGLDGEITLHINDIDNNGKVDGADTAWLFFGVRRGGRSYYALDVTSRDAPKLMWHITAPDDSTAEFGLLGLTFSKPKVVKSAFGADETGNLVVIFGGGYDTKKDASGANAHDDDNGAAVYMVDAVTGEFIESFPTGENNGIASSIASLDSDSDGFVDRLYVGDTGGNVLRVDMPDADTDNASIITLARLGGVTKSYDRRFFNEPSIVRTYILESTDIGTEEEPNVIKKEVPYDAIVLGSGDRVSPTGVETDDMFFMIKDKYIKTQQFGASPATAVPTAITLSTLYDYTDNPFEGYPALTSDQNAKLIDASEMSGWYFSLELLGEKTSAKAIVINNVVYFTTYNPSVEAACSVVPGDSWLYAVDLSLGIKKYNWSEETDNREDRIKHIGHQFLGAPTLISTSVLDPDTELTKTQGNLIVGKEVIPIGFTLQTMRTSLTIPENQ